MISVEEAINNVIKECDVLSQETMSPEKAVGYVLSEDILSPINMPPFRQSAMDGYAINYSETIIEYVVIDEIPAGMSSTSIVLKPGEAARIFTGASVPTSANIVVKQEIVVKNDNKISFTEAIKNGENIRPIGEQIKQGDLALAKGSKLSPGAIGFICGLGINQINVVKKPSISVIATGSELVKPGNPLSDGKIYESNSYMLCSALEYYGYTNYTIKTIDDSYEKTLNAISDALKNNDVVIMSGGISVGDYDFVGKSLNALEVDEIFYKVKQKPGKPLFFGKKEKKVVFALPGNPAAAMTSFYTYVLTALDKLSGQPNPGLKTVECILDNDYLKTEGRAHFLKAKKNENKVTILEGQSSAMLKAFATADSIVYVPEFVTKLYKGDLVTVYLLQ